MLGFQRRHSLCPVTLPNSKFNSESEACLWLPWSREGQLSSSLSHIPFRVDRSVSMIEGAVREDKMAAAPPPPPPGLSLSRPHISTRYKTELCRTYEENGSCKYGTKCQFAHGLEELRGLSRHPKYKTEACRTFHTIGFCPYGARCHFIHNADEADAVANGSQKHQLRPPLLRHSFSFAGFSSSQTLHPLDASSLLFSRASSVSPPPSSSVSPDLLSPLKHCGIGDLRFYAASKPQKVQFPPPGLQRCSSADSLSEEGYTSSCSLSSASSGTESPGLEGRRLPIFSRLSVPDE